MTHRHSSTMDDLREQFGNIDIYLFDQLLRGRIRPGMRVLDAGCGSGRNIVFLLRGGYEVFGADGDPAAVQTVRRLAQALAPHLPADNFRHEPLERLTFPERSPTWSSAARSCTLPKPTASSTRCCAAPGGW